VSTDHQTGHELATVPAGADADPIPNPGLPEHLPRPTDIDEAAEKRAERQVATLFGLSALFALLTCVAYFTLDVGDNPTVFLGMGASNVALGGFLGLALLCIGIGAIQWSRKLMADHEIVEYRHPAGSSEEDRTEAVAAFEQGLQESGIARRPLVRNSLLGAVGLLGLPAIVMLRDLGPTPGQVADSGKLGAGLEHTVWSKGMRVVQDVDGARIKPSDMQVGQLVNAEPEVFFPNPDTGAHSEYEGTELLQQKAKAAVILVRMQPDDIKPWKGRENWGVEGILCFS
jgi:ubiquinol-cytochrome c reductase iron-sulfur subunit